MNIVVEGTTMRKLKLFFYKLYQAYLILKLRQAHDKDIKKNFLIKHNELLKCIRVDLLDNYRLSMGLVIPIITRFKTAHHFFEWMNKVVDKIDRNDYIVADVIYPIQEQTVISLDRLLTDEGNVAYDIIDFYNNLREVLERLNLVMINVKDDDMKEYYYRRLSLINSDIANYIEGLLFVTKQA